MTYLISILAAFVTLKIVESTFLDSINPSLMLGFSSTEKIT